MAFDDLKKVCTFIGVLDPSGILEALRFAQYWARRASQYNSLVQRNHEVNEALAKILEDNSKMLSERVVTDLDNRLALNLSDAESSGGVSSKFGPDSSSYGCPHRVPSTRSVVFVVGFPAVGF